MKTLSIHTCDELVERWKRWAEELDDGRMGTYEAGKAQGYRVCATELMAVISVSMELEAAHHGDPRRSRARTATAAGRLFEKAAALQREETDG